jgi:hypothetical protein
MSGLRGTVWIGEDVASDDERGGVLYTGRFSAHHDTGRGLAEELTDAAADDAIAWGRERAPLVWIRLADGDWLAAGSGHETWAERWAPAASVSRRRPAGEEWRDRPEDAERVAWSVQVDLTPPYAEPRPDWDEQVARIAARGGASGWRARRLMTGATPGEGWFAHDGEDNTGRATLRAPVDGPDAGLDLTTYRLDFSLDAATAVHAMEYGLDRCLVPRGWAAVAWARPLEAAHPA